MGAASFIPLTLIKLLQSFDTLEIQTGKTILVSRCYSYDTVIIDDTYTVLNVFQALVQIFYMY